MEHSPQQAIRYWTLAQPVVSAYVTAVVRDFRDRDDVLQEIAAAVLESFPTYDPSRPFVGWALGIARNQTNSYFRNHRRNRLVFDAETIEMLSVALQKTQPENNRLLDSLKFCLEKLEGRARQLCSLRYENDLKPAAIAEILGMAPNTVAKALQRIREQLRQCIEQQVTIDGGRA